MSRGRCWIDALATRSLPSPCRSVAVADCDLGESIPARLIAVVPDPGNPFPRARGGEVGLVEGVSLARAVREVIATDDGVDGARRRAIVAIVDVPSQAYGREEERHGEYLYVAAAVDAYAAARVAGHPIVALVVGSAVSGGFLAHGLQANQILALDDDEVEIQAMHEPAAARITQRTTDELDRLAQTVTPLSFDVRVWATLGHCDGLLAVSDPDHPTSADASVVRDALRTAVARARTGPRDLTNRLQSAGAQRTRQASRRVRERMEEQWQ